MKNFIFIMTFLFLPPTFAKDINYIHSDKLQITGGPKNLYTFQGMHYDRMMGVEPANKITVDFDIDNVTAIIIHDMNAKNNKCGKDRKKELFYLVFNKPEKNVKSIRTVINGPCLVDNEAVLRLRVSTADGKYYENIITILSAHHNIDGEY